MLSASGLASLLAALKWCLGWGAVCYRVMNVCWLD